MSECSFSFVIRELIAVVIAEGDYELFSSTGVVALDFSCYVGMLSLATSRPWRTAPWKRVL